MTACARQIQAARADLQHVSPTHLDGERALPTLRSDENAIDQVIEDTMAFWPKKSDGAATTRRGAGTGPKLIGLASRITPIAAGQPNDPTLPPDPTAPGAAPPAAQPLTDEQKKDAAMASKLMMAAFGEITSVLLRAKDYRNKPLASLEELAVPAVLSVSFRSRKRSRQRMA